MTHHLRPVEARLYEVTALVVFRVHGLDEADVNERCRDWIKVDGLDRREYGVWPVIEQVRERPQKEAKHAST